MENVYTNPEYFGLEVISSIDDPEASYTFDMIVVWRRLEDRKLFWATDSGCSCPVPFEEYAVSDLSPLPETARDLDAELRRTRIHYGEYGDTVSPFWDINDVLDLRNLAYV